MDKKTADGFVEAVLPELEQRLSEYRYAHSLGVAQTARNLAKVYGVDRESASLAGLLHDWDKDLSEQQLIEDARAYGIDIPDDRASLNGLLHALTGAENLRRRFPELDEDILQAIARHTTAAIGMSDLDKVVYCADLLEPLRSKSFIEDIRFNVGDVSLDELFLQCYTCSLRFLIDKRRIIFPGTVDIWNSLVTDR